MNKKKEMKTAKKPVSKLQVTNTKKKTTPRKKSKAKKETSPKKASSSPLSPKKGTRESSKDSSKESSKPAKSSKSVKPSKQPTLKEYSLKGVSKTTSASSKSINDRKKQTVSKKDESLAKEDASVIEVIRERKREEKGIFLVIESKKILRWIAVFLFLMLSFLVFNSISLIKTNNSIKEYLETAKRIDEVLNKDDVEVVVSEDSSKVVIPGWRSFGDNFSSEGYLDMNKTNMFLDTSVTSLVFPPVFSLDYVGSGEESVDSSWTVVGPKNSCYLSPSNSCLEVIDNTLVYNKRKIDLPQEMKDEKINRIDSSFLSSIFVLSFSVEEGSEERVYSYTFDGRRYRPLIGKDSDKKIITKYSRTGGIAVAGGSDDDFILLYSGYEGFAYHVQEGRLKDISQFFGLRVVDGGFYPYIIKQGEGVDSLWYILSLSEGKPKLIKLWQNTTSDIQGAIDLSYIFKDFSSLKLDAFKEIKGKRGEFMFSFSSSLDSQSLGLKEAGIWLFKDGGFDNSQERRVVSTNLNYSSSELTSVAIDNLSCNADEGSFDLYFLASNGERSKFDFENEVKFKEGNTKLYWEAVFKPSSSLEYSPFFDHINSLQFFLTGK